MPFLFSYFSGLANLSQKWLKMTVCVIVIA